MRLRFVQRGPLSFHDGLFNDFSIAELLGLETLAVPLDVLGPFVAFILLLLGNMGHHGSL